MATQALWGRFHYAVRAKGALGPTPLKHLFWIITPLVPAIPYYPGVPEVPYQPATPEVLFQAAIPEVPYQPAKPEVLFQAAIPPDIPEVPYQPATPEVLFQAAIPEVPYQPATPEVLFQAAIPPRDAVPEVPAVGSYFSPVGIRALTLSAQRGNIIIYT
jgi:hypothetical protein